MREMSLGDELSGRVAHALHAAVVLHSALAVRAGGQARPRRSAPWRRGTRPSGSSAGPAGADWLPRSAARPRTSTICSRERASTRSGRTLGGTVASVWICCPRTTADRLPHRGATCTAVSKTVRHERVHNLTVEGVHTYYVLAGDSPILVHNCQGGVDANGNSLHMQPYDYGSPARSQPCCSSGPGDAS
jgi:hypothetical protein